MRLRPAGAGVGFTRAERRGARAAVADGSIDTVVVAFTDMQGRLLGKRASRGVLPSTRVAEHGIEGCNYLLALEMEMDPVPGYEIASWERGYGDFVVMPDLATLRRIPWLEGTALVLCDVAWARRLSGRSLAAAGAQAPGRACGRAPASRPMFGSELEFFLLKETYEEAHAKHYRDLTPSVPYILDYHILATTYDEPLLRQIRNGCTAPGFPSRPPRARRGRGSTSQLPLRGRADDGGQPHVYKNGVKEIAHLNGCSITFMAKPDHTWIGSSCHIHSSLWRDGENAFAGESDVFEPVPRGPDRVPAGACGLRRADDQLVQAVRGRRAGPRRRLPGATTTARAAFASSGTASRCGRETRIPGADVEPVPRLRGPPRCRPRTASRTRSSCRPPLEGNAYESDAERFPGSLREAIDALEGGSMARAGLRRRGRRPLPELRAHRAAPVRRGRHVLRARAALRARMRPVIGITSYVEEATLGRLGSMPRRSFRSATCARSSAQAGGRCRPAHDDGVDETLDVLDGIVFSGGSDLDPGLYGPSRIRRRPASREVRDRAELALLEAALERDMPVLASAAAPGAERRARRRPRAAPARRARARGATGTRRASSPSTR